MMVRHTTSIPVGRSVSSPAFSSHVHPALSLGMNPMHVGSTHSLHSETRPRVSTLYGDAYNYPLVKPLSPIVEQDYFSPESPRRNIPLPPEYEKSVTISTSVPSPAGTHSTNRPSPVNSIPFITRPINRSLSQSTHRSALSTTSTVAGSLPLSDVRPPFHLSQDGDGPPLRTGKSSNLLVMPTILAGSSEEYDNGEDVAERSSDGEAESPHDAESFVTANDTSPTHVVPPSVLENGTQLPVPTPAVYPQIPVEYTETDVSMIYSDGTASSLPSSRSPPSTSESFIRRRWDKDARYPSGRIQLKAKRQCFYADATPAFWAFWLGFLFPVLWLIGGWHFTHFGEQPARLTFWEFYFNGAYWKELFCCGRGKVKWEDNDLIGSTGTGKGKGKAKERPTKIPTLPRWITEKQSTDVKKARLNDAKRSLKGISFGYPFVPRPIVYSSSDAYTPTRGATRRIMVLLCKPHRFFDQLYGIRLTDVNGKREAPRRMFDPWIQRCRYASIYLLIVLLVGLGTAATCLIIFSLRDFK
ncbi:hypothetical protein GYMLUDRAFT_662385 [Collybiopsis luxurians FD-317 M1]|uniref:Uncharacterized protein n=1 Tax=Collybiopsis luxurians FD-317 M1 TaxID=944289 RepID=A0A0D0BW89_9AGAR|nr:hypothetical protein GYMLUDRAFT_662385 [Collybiopsis luxurians FD-317 M1]